MSDTQAILSDLARVRAIFQLRAISAHLSPPLAQHPDHTANQRADFGRDGSGRVELHGSAE